MILAYSSYSKLVTTGHMTLRFELFFRGKLPTGKKETCKFGQGKYTIVQILVTLQHVCGYKYAEVTEDTLGLSKEGYFLDMSHIWCS